jgi:hypothetical protein
MKDLHLLQGNQRSLAIHTNSRISLDAIANPCNHQILVERIGEDIRRLENDNQIIHFTWVKACASNYGNELVDHLVKEAACDGDADFAYIKIPKSAVTSKLKEQGVQVWQGEWAASNKGELTKTFFPSVKDRLSTRLQMCVNLSMIVTGHGILRSYFHRYKIAEERHAPVKRAPQTTDHLLWECDLLRKQRQIFRNRIMKAGGSWPITNSDYQISIQNFFTSL